MFRYEIKKTFLMGYEMGIDECPDQPDIIKMVFLSIYITIEDYNRIVASLTKLNW